MTRWIDTPHQEAEGEGERHREGERHLTREKEISGERNLKTGKQKEISACSSHPALSWSLRCLPAHLPVAAPALPFVIHYILPALLHASLSWLSAVCRSHHHIFCFAVMQPFPGFVYDKVLPSTSFHWKFAFGD
jgi:hypothetical protein